MCEICTTIKDMVKDIPEGETLFSITFTKREGFGSKDIQAIWKGTDCYMPHHSPLMAVDLIGEALTEIAELWGMPRELAYAVATKALGAQILSQAIVTDHALTH